MNQKMLDSFSKKTQPKFRKEIQALHQVACDKILALSCCWLEIQRNFHQISSNFHRKLSPKILKLLKNQPTRNHPKTSKPPQPHPNLL